MPSLPNPARQVVGYTVGAADWDNLADAGTLAVGRPFAQYYPTTSGNIAVPDTSWTALGLDSKFFDVDPYGGAAQWSVVHPTRLLLNYNAAYRICAHVVWPSTGTGIRRCMIRLNAAGNVALGTHLDEATTSIDTNGLTRLRVFANHYAVAGQYVELFAWQNSGSSVNVQSGNVVTWLSIELVSGIPGA